VYACARWNVPNGYLGKCLLLRTQGTKPFEIISKFIFMEKYTAAAVNYTLPIVVCNMGKVDQS
jgi:hypothetical protein